MAFDPLPGALLGWEPTSESLDAWLRYNVRRRALGDTGDGTRIAVISDPSVTSYTDYTIPSATPWQYAVTQTVLTGSDELESEPGWTTVEGNVYSAFVHDWLNPAYYVELRGQTQTRGIEPDISYVLPWGAERETAHVGSRLTDTFEVGLTDVWRDNPEVWTGLRTLLERQARLGSVMVLRQHRDVRVFCTIEAPSASDSPAMFQQSVRVRAVAIDEEV